MASYTKESSDRNSGSGLSFRDRATVADNQNNASTNPQDKVLLQALQDFIIPLIQGQNNIIQADLGPEAGKLIAALREFISTIVVPSQSSEKKMIAVDLVEGQTKIEDDPDEESNYDYDAGENASSSKIESSSAELNGVATNEENPVDQVPVTWWNPEPTFPKKFWSALRDHVFNSMPIRLISFEPHGASFAIKLLEREDVYARLISMPLKNMEDDELFLLDNDGRMEEEMVARFHARYAILSHTWLRTTPGEITYGNWNKGQFDTNSPGYTKLVNFCQTAWRDHGLTFGWMDTICINKDSSSELDESIRSMYKWYELASVCLVYLADTKMLSEIYLDRWFTRGWTLQELLAPRVLKFYNMEWKRFSELVNDKPHWSESSDIENANVSKILENIEMATTITASELKDGGALSPISRRMEMAAYRTVTREEDTAYSLMGIFDVSIATAYGEGAQRAFSRLLQEILTTCAFDVMDIFNWAGRAFNMLNSRLLPNSPQNYVNRSTVEISSRRSPVEPLTLTHMGLRIPVILMPAISTNDSNFEYHPVGAYKATANCSPLYNYYRFLSNTHHLLDKRCSGPDGQKGDGLRQTTFAVLNFYRGTANTIKIRKICLAMALNCDEDAGKVSTPGSITCYRTVHPIVFNLKKSAIADENGEDDSDSDDDDYQIKIDELPNHGMQLVTLHL